MEGVSYGHCHFANFAGTSLSLSGSALFPGERLSITWAHFLTQEIGVETEGDTSKFFPIVCFGYEHFLGLSF
jgi:hypothetical protein